MDDELLKSLFLKARDQYESAIWWACIAVLLLFAFHLMTFSQFSSLGKQVALTQSQIARLSRLESMVTNLSTDLNQLEGTAIKASESHLDQTFNEMIQDFEALDRSVAQLRTPVTERFTRAILDLPSTERSAHIGLQIQMAPIQAPEPKLFALGEEIKQHIQQAQNIEELRQILLPFIEEKLISPHFGQLTRYWQQTILPGIKQQADSIQQELPEIKPLLSEAQWEKLWREIQQTVGQTVRVAATLKFQPPSDLNRVFSVAGKRMTLEDIGTAVVTDLRKVSNSEAITTLQTQVRAAFAQQKKLRDTLQAALHRVEEQFNTQ